jgi:RNA polymerase sigma factor (sigma-70 family)
MIALPTGATLRLPPPFAGEPGPLRTNRALHTGMDRRGESANALEQMLSAAMAAAQAGDRGAYRGLLRACMPVIAATARGKGLTGEAVEDVVQETLLTIHRARASYDPARPFLPWLRAIAQRRTIDALRLRKRRAPEAHDPVAYETYADETLPAAGQGIEARERDARLARAIAALPEGQRQAVEQLSLREHSLKEAAAITGRSTGAIKVNLHRALKALRTALAKDRSDGHV